MADKALLLWLAMLTANSVLLDIYLNSASNMYTLEADDLVSAWKQINRAYWTNSIKKNMYPTRQIKITKLPVKIKKASIRNDHSKTSGGEGRIQCHVPIGISWKQENCNDNRSIRWVILGYPDPSYPDQSWNL